MIEWLNSSLGKKYFKVQPFKSLFDEEDVEQKLYKTVLKSIARIQKNGPNKMLSIY